MTARLMPLSEGSHPIALDKAITLIGRHPDCDAVLDENQKISRRHCCIAQVENRLVLRDLGSMNGIRVNGETIVETDLREGDEITIGDEEFVLELSSALDSSRQDPPTAAQPTKGKRAPKPVTAPPARPSVTPQDISQEFPVAIPEDDIDDDLRLNFPVSAPADPPMSPSALNKLIVTFEDEKPSDFDEQILELDSGELKIDDLDNLGKQ